MRTTAPQTARAAPRFVHIDMSLHDPRPTHLFTVDVEEYFQVNAFDAIVSRDQWLAHPTRVGRSVDQLLESLDRYGVRGTFFTLGWIARNRPEVVRAIASAGHEIASHGFWHQRIPTIGVDAFRKDVRRSKATL